MTVSLAQFLAGTPVEYFGLGSHASTRFRMRLVRVPESPLPYLDVIELNENKRAFPRQLCGEARATAIFANLPQDCAP